MKNISKKIVFVPIAIFICLFLFNFIFNRPLDKIHNYDITIDAKDDGSLDMLYRLKWEVLNSTKEGPLTWVKIGVANRYVSNIKAETDNIREIKYYVEGSNKYIKIDFDRPYHKGEIIDFSFSLQQDYVYTIDKKYRVTYKFTPAWFNDIKVKNMTIRWNSAGVIDANTKKINYGYYEWKESLSKGERHRVKVVYNFNSFNFNNKNVNRDTDKIYQTIISITILLLFLICVKALSGGYEGGFGVYRYRRRHHGFFGGGGFGGFGGGGGCACAGGSGRAGCSLKDFYRTKLKTKNIRKIIDNKK